MNYLTYILLCGLYCSQLVSIPNDFQVLEQAAANCAEYMVEEDSELMDLTPMDSDTDLPLLFLGHPAESNCREGHSVSFVDNYEPPAALAVESTKSPVLQASSVVTNSYSGQIDQMTSPFDTFGNSYNSTEDEIGVGMNVESCNYDSNNLHSEKLLSCRIQAQMLAENPHALLQLKKIQMFQRRMGGTLSKFQKGPKPYSKTKSRKLRMTKQDLWG